MKKFIFTALTIAIALTASAQPKLSPWSLPGETPHLPFQKLITMSNYELTDAGFSYSPSKNRYRLKKGDFWGAMEVRPKFKNYKMIVQYSETGMAFIRVEFTNPDIYHEIMEYVINQLGDYQETVSDGEIRVTFREGYLTGTLVRRPKHKAVTHTSEDGTYSVTRDLSHENFTYILSTGKEPSSRWHDKQKKKQEKREKKGRKAQSPLDFM